MKTKVNSHNRNILINNIILALLVSLLMVLPIFRGLFFTKEILITHIISFALYLFFLIVKFVRKEQLFLDSLMDLSVLLLILAYFLPLIFGQWVNLRDAWGEVIKYVNLFVIYSMVQTYARQGKNKKIILSGLVVSGVVVALIGIFSAIGILELNGALIGSNRIASTLQYPNTLAAFLGTLYLIDFALLEAMHSKWKRFTVVPFGYIIFFTFILTYSRAAWILLPIFVLGLFIVLTKESKKTFLSYLFATWITSIAILKPFTDFLTGLNKIGSVVVLIIGMGLSIALFNGIEIMRSKAEKVNYRLLYLVTGLIVLISIGMLVIAINTTQPLVFDNLQVTENYLNQISRNISNVSANRTYTLNVRVEAFKESQEESHWPWCIQIYGLNSEDERVLLHQELGNELGLKELNISFDTKDDTDSLVIFFTNMYPKTKAIFYKGGIYDQEGTLVKQLKLSYRYLPESLVSRFNAISLSQRSVSGRLIYYKDALKIFSDYPFVGAGGGAWANLYEKYQSQPYVSTTTHSYLINILVETGIVGIMVFLLILGLLLCRLWISWKQKNVLTITIIIAVLFLLAHSIFDFNFSFVSILLIFGALLGCLDMPKQSKFLNRGIPQIVLIILVAPSMIFTISLYSAHSSAIDAVSYVKSGNTQAAYEAFGKAIKRDPFTYNYRLDQALLLEQSGVMQGDLQQIALAETQILKALEYAPYRLDIYQRLIEFYIERENYEEAMRYAQDTADLAPYKTRGYEIKFNALVANATDQLNNGDYELAIGTFKQALNIEEDLKKFNLKVKNPIIFTDDMLLAMNKVAYILDKIKNAESINNLKNIAYVTYFNIDADLNNIPDGWKLYSPEGSKLQIELKGKDDNGVTLFKMEQSNGILYSNNLSLRPNTKYNMEVEFEEGSSYDDARIALLSRSGTEVQFSSTDPKDQKNTFSFVTTDDIEPGSQYITIQHLGRNNKPFTIKSLTLFEDD